MSLFTLWNWKWLESKQENLSRLFGFSCFALLRLLLYFSKQRQQVRTWISAWTSSVQQRGFSSWFFLLLPCASPPSSLLLCTFECRSLLSGETDRLPVTAMTIEGWPSRFQDLKSKYFKCSSFSGLFFSLAVSLTLWLWSLERWVRWKCLVLCTWICWYGRIRTLG